MFVFVKAGCNTFCKPTKMNLIHCSLSLIKTEIIREVTTKFKLK